MWRRGYRGGYRVFYCVLVDDNVKGICRTQDLQPIAQPIEIADYALFISADEYSWQEAASETWANDSTLKTMRFEKKLHIR